MKAGVHRCAEFDCCECGRHIVLIASALPEPRLCATCMMIPGWFTYPDICEVIDPEHDGRDRSAVEGLSQ